MEENMRDFSSVPVVWEPKENTETLTKQFMKRVQTQYNVKISDYWDLHKWSVENVEEFWKEIWQLSGIICSKSYDQVIDISVPIGEFHEWFKGAKMNCAENVLKYRDNRVALIAAGEDKETERITYAEMYEEVKLYAAALRKQGLQKGDRVACYMSNRKEAVFAAMATTSLGAIWVGALPLMGPQPVISRFSQLNPKILFTVDCFPHDRKEYNMLPKLKSLTEELPSIEKVIIVASKPNSILKDITDIRNSCFLTDFLETGKNSDGSVPEMVFEQVSFTHPVFISFTSGTTGLPKALYHDCGILLATSRDIGLQNDGNRDTCWFSMSPVGWATWNVFFTMHFLGMKVVLFEGLPYYLSPTYFWDMIDELEISNLLLVPSVLDELEKKNYVPAKHNHLRSLKFIMSGGSVVKPQNYDFMYQKIKKDVIFTSVYGSTECSGIPLFHDRTLKVYKGEVSAPSLGVECQCLDESGNPVLGTEGELVFTVPFPNLPLGIWGDNNRSRFKKSYCEKFPGNFAVGDLAIINPITKGIIIRGRSDETLNPKGCRFGSSDIYNIVDTFPEIADSICVSQYNDDKLERAVLFVKMKSGHLFEDSLIKRLRTAITQELSSRHVPEVILEVDNIPYNINGKKMESTIKRIINKMPFNVETVVNPEGLKSFMNLPELNDF